MRSPGTEKGVRSAAQRRGVSRPGLTNERLVALFFAAVIMFTPPFLGIFNKTGSVLGIPVLYFYLFAAWAFLILLMALVMERTIEDADDEPVEGGPETIGANEPDQSGGRR